MFSEAAIDGDDVPETGLVAWIDDIADRYEAAWQALTPPRLEDFLGDAMGERRCRLLAELLKIDRAYRHKVAAPASSPGVDTPAPGQTPAPQVESSGGGEHDWPVLPDYENLAELGRGGMGVVYKARQKSLPRVVAVKMLLAGEPSGERRRQRFLVESQSVARLQHPNIVQIHEVGEYQGGMGAPSAPYCVLEYVPGGSLAQKLAGTPQPALQAAELIETLARTVHYAHQQGIIHRDLKPANILLSSFVISHSSLAKNQVRVPDDQGRMTNDQGLIPKITDFGLAKLLENGSGQSVTGEILGTPSYMAPEQAEGKHKEIGPLTDVYGLGTILYEMLTGRPPFKGESTLETLVQVRTQDPVPPRRLQPKVPRDLETICLKAMAKSPGRRYAGAAELAADLRRFLDGRPILARPVRNMEKLWRWCRRNPAVAGLTAAVGLSLLAGTGISTFFVVQASERAKETLREQERTQQEQRIADRHAYVSDLRLARPYWEAAQIGWLRDLLDGQRCERTGDEDLRGFEWYYWHRLCHSDLGTLTGHTNGVNGVAFSPVGRRLASASVDQTVRVWDAATRREIHTFKGHTGGVRGVAFSPDGRRIASASDDQTVRVWDANAGKESLILTGHHTGAVADVVFSPDGQRLASAGGDQTVRVRDAATGRTLFACKGHTASVNSVAFSLDGRWLASASLDQTVRLWDATRGQEVRTFKGHTKAVRGVAFSPDSLRLASASEDRTVKVWDVANEQDVRTFEGHTDHVNGVAFSPDGQWIASASHDRTVREWDVDAGKELFVLKGHTGYVEGVAFSADGKFLASASDDGTVRVWDATRDQESLILKGHTRKVFGLAFSPDDQRLASADGEVQQPGGEVRIWDVASGRKLRSLNSHTKGVNGVAFSGDGQWLASASDDGTVKLWDAASGQEICTFEGHQQPVWSVGFSRDGQWLASASEDGTVKVWDWSNGRELHTFTGHAGKVSGVAFSPDGQRLASAGWDHTVKLWDATTGRQLQTFKGHSGAVWCVVFRPDGQQLASASNDGTVRLWDAHSGQEVRTFKGHGGNVSGVAFSREGKRLASASWDRTVKIWDVASGQELLTFTHPREVFAVAFSRDGHRLASACWDHAVRIWDATPVPDEPAAEELLAGKQPDAGKSR